MSEIISITIDSDGKPIFTATSSSNVGSPLMSDRRTIREKEKKKAERRGSKNRSTSQKKKATAKTVKSQKTTMKKGSMEKGKAKNEDVESSEDSTTSLMVNSLATCSIGAPISRHSKEIQRFPEYDLIRKELLVTVRDAVIQTDLF